MLREAGFKEEVARWWVAQEVKGPVSVRETTRSSHGSLEEGSGA